MEFNCSKEFVKKYNKVLLTLKAPKNQRNNFGGFNYRSCEDIQEGIKKCLQELKYDDVVSFVSDEIVTVGARYYVKATAVFTDGENIISCTAYAREPESRSKMDEAQVTGSSSSYARKYALNGLYSIDDTKMEATPEVDAQDNTKKVAKNTIEDKVMACKSVDDLLNLWKENTDKQKDANFVAVFTKRKNELSK